MLPMLWTAAAACLALPAGGVAADGAVQLTDPAGDAQVDPASIQWKQPDIIEAELIHRPDRAGDTVTGRMLVDVLTDPGVQNALYAGRWLTWRIDTDGNPATGISAGATRGADLLVAILGTTSGAPTYAMVRSVNARGDEFNSTPDRYIPLQMDATGFTWRQSAAEMGIARGRPIRVWFESAYVTTTTRVFDRVPDDGRAVTLIPGYPAPFGDTGEATGVTTGSALVPVLVDGSGIATEWYVRYVGPDGRAFTTPVATSVGPPAQAVVPLPDLAAGTRYEFQVVARNGLGEARSTLRAFTTLAPPPPPAPPATTAPLTASVASVPTSPDAPPPPTATAPPLAVGPTSAQVAARINARGGSTAWWFEWGPTPMLGRRTPTRSAAAGDQQVSATLASLGPDTVYFYRLVVMVNGVRSEGALQQIRTAPVARVVLSGAIRVVCTGAVCRVSTGTRLATMVRGANGRVLPAVAARRGMTVRVRCLVGCRGQARPLLAARGRRLGVAIPAAVTHWSLRRGAVVEVRVTRPATLGIAYRVRVSGARARGTVCRISLAGVVACPTAR